MTVTGVDDVLFDGIRVTYITISVFDELSADEYGAAPSVSILADTYDNEVAGYTGVEWRVTNDDGNTSTPGYWKGSRTTLQASWNDQQFQEIRTMMDELDISAASLGTYLPCDQYDDVARMMQVAKI